MFLELYKKASCPLSLSDRVHKGQYHMFKCGHCIGEKAISWTSHESFRGGYNGTELTLFMQVKMWKRLQGHGREKERYAQIGNPVLLETTYDEEQLRRNPNVSDAQSASHRHNAQAVQP